MPRWVQSLIEDWPKALLRPITVNLLTALFVVLFSSIIFAPVRNWLFPPKKVEGYPLMCVAEPAVASDGSLQIEFFLINKTHQEYTREDLDRFLKNNNPAPETQFTPDILLRRVRRSVGQVQQPYGVDVFNDSKGVVIATLEADENVRIRIDRIRPHAILEVVIPVEHFPAVTGLRRSASEAVPFEYEKDACYSRR